MLFAIALMEAAGIARTAALESRDAMRRGPDRLIIYLVLGLLCALIASVTGPSGGLLTLLQVVVVVEAINLLGAPGDIGDC
jgi:hypothetical protein